MEYFKIGIGGGRCVSITYAKMAISMQEKAI